MRKGLMRIATDTRPRLSQIATEESQPDDRTSQDERVGVGEEVTVRSALSTGSLIQNVVPLSTTLSTVIVPPCSSTIPFTTVRPRPVPFPKSFVVKKGSNTFERISSGIPWPVSDTPRQT